MDREEMEEDLRENLDIPKNFRIVCRTVDIEDPASIEKCSVENCRSVIISPTDDARTIKAILAVSVLLEGKKVTDVRVNAILSRNEYLFPASIAETHNITTLRTNVILAKMIAHSCTQTGLSETFREIFNFEGSEFYLIDLPGCEGCRFEELMTQINYAVPAGIFTQEQMLLNPSPDYTVKENDRILVFSEESGSARFEQKEIPEGFNTIDNKSGVEEAREETVIFGYNETLPVILRELPENVTRVIIVTQEISQKERDALDKVAAKRNLIVDYNQSDLRSEETLIMYAKMTEHVIILSDHRNEEERADMDTIFLLLNLRDIRTRFHLPFNITVEMNKEHNRSLVGQGDHIDFLVSSSMSSLILAQLAESPELIDVFREILSNKGNELYLKNVKKLGLIGTYSIQVLRQTLFKMGYILLGYLDEKKQSTYNIPLDKELTLTENDNFIVLGIE